MGLDGVQIAEYQADADVPRTHTPKPHFHPLRTLGGAELTAFAPDDHPWHHGLQLAFPRVGDHNLWGGGTYMGTAGGYQSVDDHGSIRHAKWNHVGASGASVVISHDTHWLGHNGELLMDEVRTWTFASIEANGKSGWSLDLLTSLANSTANPLEIATPAQRGREDGGYGGLFLRLGDSFAAERLSGDGSNIDQSGSSSRTLVIHATTGTGDRVTLGMSYLPAASPGVGQWLFRFGPFSAVAWAVAYDKSLTLPIGGQIELNHRLVVLDGFADPEAVRALL